MGEPKETVINMMNCIPLIGFFLLFAIIALPVGAIAQTDLIDLESAIQRNAELLEEAHELVRETNSTKARTSLRAATVLHEQTLKLVDEGARPAIIARVATETRQAILKTISIAKQEAKLEENAHKGIERATIRLEQARTAIEDNDRRDDVAARRLLDQAREQLNLAKNHMREHMFGIALQLANSSTELSMRAIRMSRRDAASPDDVTRALDRTDEVLQRAADSEELWSHPQGEKRLRDAEDMQSKARRSASGGDYRVAMDQTRRARSIVLRLMRQNGGGSITPADVERALRLTDQILERATELCRRTEC